MCLNPIAADTGLCLRPVQYERKAGLTLKIAEQQISVEITFVFIPLNKSIIRIFVILILLYEHQCKCAS